MSTVPPKILVISPQAWGNIHISKHHYAIALADMGHEVYFVNPPGKQKNSVKIRHATSDKKISIVDSWFNNSLFLRYKLRPLYNLLVRRWLKRILHELPEIDIVWCFETNIIKDFGIFGGKKILHVVDPIDKRMVSAGKSADLIICVSNRILNQFEGINVPKQFINHALSDIAIDNVRKINLPSTRSSKKLQAGYVGNLTRRVIDVVVITGLIENHPDIDFHFWGPGDTNSILGGESSILLQKIRNLPNVFLHAPVDSASLIPAINEMDIFLLAYLPADSFYDSSNSHKLLEYWATGKIVVSTYIDQYCNAESNYLIQMSPENQNALMPEIFGKVVSDIEQWNSIELLTKRKAFALNQSYSNNTKIILSLLEKSS